MEEESVKVVTIYDLLRQSRPITATSSITPIPPSHPLNQPHFSTKSTPTSTSTSTSQNPKPLKPLTSPSLLTGTLTLNSPPHCSNTICFSFSDSRATLCCDIIHLDLRIIGKTIHVISWNFIPLKNNSGFLEIIRWSLPALLPNSDPCALHLDLPSIDCNKDSVKPARYYYVYGVLESISPVSVVPCTTCASNFNGCNSIDKTNIPGFLVNIVICECKFCNSKKDCDTVLKCLKEEEEARNNTSHCFEKPVIVYFCGAASCWNAVMCKLIGGGVLISGLKKKLVYIGKEESQLMYVTTEKALFSVFKLRNRGICSRKVDVKGKGEVGVYIGAVTGVYMHGMVVELNQNVLLLLTDSQLAVPHSLRVGAIVSVRNVHFVNPQFSWTKILILGACVKTSICLESFSPLETGCHVGSPSQSLLGTFIDSLAFSARLWVLLVISCFRKKFAGIFSEKEILGSKYKEGFVQKYARSHLPLSSFRVRHGIHMEYCKHDSCSCGNEPGEGQLKLAVPISYFVIYCETTWTKLLLERNSDLDLTGNKDPYGLVFCEGRSYNLPIRRILHGESIGVLLGKLEISPSSGRLQLIDATGRIDAVIPGLSSSWNLDSIYEVNDFTVVMEGILEQKNNLDSIFNESFSCRSIFNSVHPVRDTKLKLYLFFHLRDMKSINGPFYPCVDLKGTFEELKCGRFHLLCITHKFPVIQKFQGDQVISNRSSIHAEAIILPWDLLLDEKYRDAHPDKVSAGHSSEAVKHYACTNHHECVACKRHKFDKASSRAVSSGLREAGNGFSCPLNCCSHAYKKSHKELKIFNFSSALEIPCFVTSKSVNGQCLNSSGILHSTKANLKVNSACNLSPSKVLLEFKPESFCKYEFLGIGGYYIVKHHKEESLCAFEDANDVSGGKIVITPGTNLWSISFSSNGILLDTNLLQVSSFHDSHFSINEVHSEVSHGNELSLLRFNSVHPEIFSDISLCLSSDFIGLLEIDLKSLGEGLIKPSVSLKDAYNISQCNVNMMTASVQCSGTSDSDCHLPEGNLISLHGHVVAVHYSDDGSRAAHLSKKSHRDVHRPIFFRGLWSSSYIHVVVDNCIVKILCSLSQHSSYPIGFGPGVHATFHRILALGRQNEFILTAASFIVINSIRTVNNQYIDDCNHLSVASGLHNVSSSDSVPAALISEVMHCLEHKAVQFRGRVVAVHILVLEKNNEVVYSHSKNQSKSNGTNIPLAGLILDDGSSLCCCWANNERAATFLKLHEEIPREAYERSFYKSKKSGVACNSAIGHVNKILKRHGQLIVRNYGSISDSLCQDLTFSVGSERENVVSSSDEDLLKFIILDACFSTIWTVVGNLMDSNAVGRLEKRLFQLEMTMHPLLPNIWAAEVYHTNPLTEAREAIQGLLDM